MASLVLTVKGTAVDGLKKADDGHESLHRFAQHLVALTSGNERGTVYAQTSTSNPVAATGTLTLASCAAGDTAVIGGVTFTASSTPSGEEEFEIDGNDTADAAALAAAINAHSTLSKVVSASSALGVVTVTCLIRGVIGNFITLAETGTTITLSGTKLSGGTGGSETSATSYTFE